MNTKRLLFLPLLLFAVLVHADNTMFGDMAWRYGTTIQNDFEVKMGASLEIKTNTNEIFNLY